jgi:hypothetical protein
VVRGERRVLWFRLCLRVSMLVCVCDVCDVMCACDVCVMCVCVCVCVCYSVCVIVCV